MRLVDGEQAQLALGVQRVEQVDRKRGVVMRSGAA
jgi:hypothetical protein